MCIRDRADAKEEAEVEFEDEAPVPDPLALAVLSQVPEAGSGGQTQLRITADSQADKWRITYEARQYVTKYFASLSDESVQPKGHVGKGLIVVPRSVHARMSNISEAGQWLETESFHFGGRQVVRTAGTSAGAILKPYRELRSRRPELFENLELMSQPAANTDSIIMSWCLAQQGAEVGNSVWQRDCFAASFTTDAAKAAFLAQQLSAPILGKMTASLQLTDTDFSKRFKAQCRKEMDLRRTKSEAKARKAGD